MFRNFKYRKVLISLDLENNNMELLLKKSIFICELLNPEETYILYVNSPLAGTPTLVAGSVHEKKEDILDLKIRAQKIIPEEIFHKHNTSFVVKTGDPAEEIVNFSKEKEIDIILIGKKVRSGLESFFHLKIEQKVIKDVKCDVLTLDLTDATNE